MTDDRTAVVVGSPGKLERCKNKCIVKTKETDRSMGAYNMRYNQGRLNDFGGLRRNSKIGLFFFLKFFFFFLVIRIFFFLAPCNELVFFFSIFSSFSDHWYLNIMMN
jgi:hypothetical protein